MISAKSCRLLGAVLFLCFAIINDTEVSFAASGSGATSATQGETQSAGKRRVRKPNILFVILDDIGIDQTSIMGYGGDTPAPSPMLDTLADAGVRFRNTWSMPECSNGRMALLTGRYPFRTNVNEAIAEKDLANSHVSPYDVTVPRMLRQAGYVSALFGKYHLGGPDNDEVGNGGPGKRGWDYFYGWTGGSPAAIDSTAGGVAGPGVYSCGYVPSVNRAANGEGANSGACYTPNKRGGVSCSPFSGEADGDSAGLRCLNSGGVLVPNAACQSSPPSGVNFDTQNAYYVSPLVINRGPRVTEMSLENPAGRTYRSTIEANAAIKWINNQKGKNRPWMATLSFSAGHTPLQTPPGYLLSQATRDNLAAVMSNTASGTDCNDPAVERAVSDAMIEAMDTELARVLVSTGLARRDGSGAIVYDPQASNTMIVVIGDNGTFGDVVKAPFDPSRAKSTPYQTGVWVPLVVSGPLVAQPGRDVGYMTNAVDVFGLFGEMAGLNPHKSAAPRTIDSQPMMSYLRDPQQAAIRTFNFTQGGLNIQPMNGDNGPCVLGVSNTSTGSCSESPFDKEICEENGGVWWGPGLTDSYASQTTNGEGVSACWQVNQSIYNSLSDKNDYATTKVGMEPLYFYAARNPTYKYVNTSWYDYDPANPIDATSEVLEELYPVNESTSAAELKIDEDGDQIYSLLNGVVSINLLGQYPGAADAFTSLKDYVSAQFATQPPCPGDGNGDGLVNMKDLKGYIRTVRKWTGSSVFDFNYDGLTNATDKQTILSNIPTYCQ